MAVIDRLRELIVPLVDDSALDLYDIEHNGGVVRVLVDDPDGLDLEAITSLSRSISRVLDDHDPIPGRYTLEVSSPGLERPLRTADHFRGAVGELVKIKTWPDHDGPRRLTGAIVDVDDRSVRLRTEDDETTTLDLEAISSARTVFEWGPAPKPGGGAGRAGKSEREAKTS